jgi:flagellar hook protein FlgE
MNTAISGLNAQSSAFGNISDNVANSTTVGYKQVGTNFSDYLTTSTAELNDPGAVVATPDYQNNIQGTVTQTSTATNLAITGQGFFAVSQAVSETGGNATFNPQQMYTRAGDFQMNKDGYLVNSGGDFLNGWPVTAGVADQNSMSPIQVTETAYTPIPTKNITLSANLPATPATGTGTAASPIASTVDVYDSLGTMHALTLNWSQTTVGTTVTPNSWQLSIAAGSEAVSQPTAQNIPVTFNSDGTIATVGGSTTSGVTNFSVDLGPGLQSINLNLGTIGQASGVTQYAGTQFQLQGLTQDGVPPGAYTSTTIQANGDVVANYNNGQSRTIAQVPVVTFNDPNALQRQNGQAFTATQNSGTPLADQENSSGAGSLVASAVESSNVDIGAEFSKLIVAQQAYSANAKVVTSANQLMQTTIDMKQ